MDLALLSRRVIAATLVAVLTPVASAVCQVPQPRIVCAEYANSKAVLVANLRATKRVVVDGDTDGYLYTFSVKTLMRGDAASKFELWEENSSGRAAFEWKVGVDYVLFLARDVQRPTHAWVIDGCGNSGPVNASAKVLQAIRSHASSTIGLVYGMVSSDSLTTGVPNVTVKATGNHKSFSTITDQSGRFRLQLPAGEYIVDAMRDRESFRPEPFSYENPRNLKILPGYCAQIQFGSAGTK
jgi:hypothetical protein